MPFWLMLQVWAFAGHLAIADEAAVRERPTVSESAEREPHLDTVFAAWNKRETTNRRVSVEFTIERTSRSANFGNSYGYSSSDERPAYRLLIDGERFRFDGVGEPHIEIGGAPISAGSITVEKGDEERYQEYLAALWSAFDPPPRAAIRQPYESNYS